MNKYYGIINTGQTSKNIFMYKLFLIELWNDPFRSYKKFLKMCHFLPSDTHT